jgi:hypothetical protein
MYSKVGLCICTAAGGGSRKVTKDLKQNMFYWGIPSIFRYSINIGASNWKEVSDSKKQKIQLEVQHKSKKIKHKIEHPHVPIKLKVVFLIMRFMQKIIIGILPIRTTGKHKDGLIINVRGNSHNIENRKSRS